MTRHAKQWVVLLALGALSVACATSTQTGSRDPLTDTLTQLQERQAAGRVGAVRGYHFFSGPDVATRFTNGPVSLIPISNDLETAVTQAHEAYVVSRRTPLAPQVIQQRFALLDDYVRDVKRRGFGAMIRVTTTDPKEAHFNFTDVPEGRWLLVAEVTSRVSVLYWAVPVEVRAGQALAQNLFESNIWIEGLK